MLSRCKFWGLCNKIHIVKSILNKNNKVTIITIIMKIIIIFMKLIQNKDQQTKI
jgi:hypothetical protein